MPLVRSLATIEPGAGSFSADALRDVLRHGAEAADRRQAAFDLAQSPGACEELGAALARDRDSGVRAAICCALAEIGTESAACVLVSALSSGDVGLRSLAIEALQRLGPVAMAQMAPLLHAPDAELRICSVSVLEGLDAHGARGLLVRALDNEGELNVGLAMVEALSHIGAPDDAAALRRFAARFPNEPFVTFAVDLACGRVALA